MTTTYNNNLSPLPFYKNIEEQNHRLSYSYGSIYPLYGSTSLLVPFQVMRAHRNDAITLVEIYTKDGVFVRDMLTMMQNAGLSVVNYSSYGIDVIKFPANYVMATQLEEAQYYLKISDGVDTWYSDVMTLINDLSPYTCIEWFDTEDLIFDAGIINYTDGYRNRLYFVNEVGKPDYQFEEEGESRDGYFFAQKQISYKTYKCNILAPEFLTDVMRLIRLSDVVNVRDKYGRTYHCYTFLITPKWETQGDLASVEIEFTTNTVVKSLGRGYIIPNYGDYNDDFNDDYNNYDE